MYLLLPLTSEFGIREDEVGTGLLATCIGSELLATCIGSDYSIMLLKII
jgi:hypothetical protein